MPAPRPPLSQPKGSLPTPTPTLTRLPLWQRRYVAAVAAGATSEAARLIANVSNSTVREFFDPDGPRYSGAFARAHDAALAGLAATGVEAARALAGEAAGQMVAEAVQASREAPHERDRVTNRRLVLEASGTVGAAAQQDRTDGARLELTAGQVALVISGLTPAQMAGMLAQAQALIEARRAMAGG